MNCLAHLQLSSVQNHALAGALLGDFVKGNLADHSHEQGGNYSALWINSIRFHRQIDTFTDTHPLVIQAKQRFEPPFRRYAGIIIDLMFDHFLVHDWHSYMTQPLAEFERHCYQQFARDASGFPSRAAALSRHLHQHQLLSGYGDLTTINRALGGVGRRLSRDNPLHSCLPAIRQQLSGLKQDFDEFYPQLQLACAEFESTTEMAATCA